LLSGLPSDRPPKKREGKGAVSKGLAGGGGRKRGGHDLSQGMAADAKSGARSEELRPIGRRLPPEKV